MIRHQINYNPEFQLAYLHSMNQRRNAGYVNPQLSTNAALGGYIGKETQRLRALDVAGEERDRIKKIHNEDSSYRNKLLKMRKNELESQKAGSTIATILNVGRLGLGYLDAKKTQELAQDTKLATKNKLEMQLEYLRANNPQGYKWITSQPYIQKQIKKFGIKLNGIIDTEDVQASDFGRN